MEHMIYIKFLVKLGEKITGIHKLYAWQGTNKPHFLCGLSDWMVLHVQKI
jgi:hypothetical protein